MNVATLRRGTLFLAAAVLTACPPTEIQWPDSGAVEPPKDSGVVKDCRDADGDGWPGTGDCSDVAQPDCEDTNAAVNPASMETCDNIDNNCNLSIDEGLTVLDFFADTDGDLFGTGAPNPSCKGAIPGKVTRGGDCDDTDPNVFPGAPEYCNGKDDDCNGTADNNVVSRNYYVDGDADGYGAGAGVLDCKQVVPGKAPQAGDCNDANPAVHPGAAEVCNGRDDNCDTQTDETFPGKGTACTTAELGVCTPGTKQCVSTFEQCVRTQNPSAEICDDKDNNCNGTIDEGFAKGQACSVGLGVCARNSTYVCGAGGGLKCPVDAGAPTPPSCDNLDNNCNGVADEFAAGKSSLVAQAFDMEALDIAPMHLSTGSCNGGNNPGGGTDAWLAYVAAYVKGTEVFAQQVKEDGSPMSTPPVKISGTWTGYLDVAIGQAGPGMVVVAQESTLNLDLFYLAPGPVARLVTPANGFISAPAGGSVTVPHVVRASAGRGLVFWRETTGSGGNSVRMKRMSFSGNDAAGWVASEPAGSQDVVTGISGNSYAVASNRREDLDSLPCPATPLAKFAVAYKFGEILRLSVFNEDGTVVGSPMTIYTGNAGADQVTEFDVAWNQVGGVDRWVVVYSVAWPATNNAGLYFWQNNGAAGNLGFFGGIQAASVQMPLVVNRPNQFFLSALSYGTANTAQEPQVQVAKVGFDGGSVLPLTQVTAFSGCSGVACPDGAKKLAFPVPSSAGPLKTNGFIIYGTSLGNVNSTVISCN
ncbi:MAG: putative metal-binding motif-containing protein [Myxococcaceae bacterium]